MSISSRINEIETHLKEDYTNLEALGYDIPQDKNIENIASVLDNVWENQSHIEETGTTLSLNTNKGKAKVDLLGNTYQESTTGKNMYEGSQDFSGTWSNESYWTTDSNTYNGLVVKKRDGVWSGLAKEIEVESGKTYTFSCYIKSDNSRKIAMYFSGGTYSTSIEYNIDTTTTWTRYSYTFTLGGSGTIRPRIENRSSSESGYTYICGYQLEESASMTDYEPYTYGASPNPNYPQEIHSVKGDNVVRVEGKNLFTGDFSQFDSKGGTGTTYGYFALPTNNELYTLTIIAKNDFTPTASTYLGFSKNGGQSTGGVQWIMSEAIGSMTAGQKRTLGNFHSGNYLPFVSIFANTAYALEQFTENFYIQLEKGEESSYQEYKETDYEVNLPVENLFTSSIYNDIDASGNAQLQDNGYYEVKFNSNKTIMEGQLKSNTQYTISASAYGSASGNSGVIGFNYTDNTSEIKGINQTTPYLYTITSSANKTIKNIKITYGSQNTTYIKDLQIEEGTKANSYTPYGTTPIQLCKIGDYQDKFFKAINGNTIYDNLDSSIKNTLDYGSWYLHKEIGKVVLNGTETWYLQEIVSGKNWYTNILIAKTNVGRILNNLGTYFQFSSSIENVPEGSCFISASKNLNYIDNNYSSTDTFKEHLRTNNMILYIPLATPTYTKIEGTLKKQLEDVWRANTYDNQTNVSQVNNDLPFELFFKALGTPSNTLLGLSRQLNQIEEEPIEESGD